MAPKNAHFEIISDPNVQIDWIVIQCQHPEDPFLLDVLKALRKSVHVIVRVQKPETAEALWDSLVKEGFKNRRDRFRFAFTENRPIKKWGRDPLLVLRDPRLRLFTLIAAYPADPWFADLLFSTNLGITNLVNNAIPRPATWLLEGGSVTADDTFVYVTQSAIERMRRDAQGTAVLSESEAQAAIRNVTGRQVLILPISELHSDRFHVPIGRTRRGERTSVLADPVAALRIIAALKPEEREKAIASITAFGKAYKNAKFIRSSEGQTERKELQEWLNQKNLERLLNIDAAWIQHFEQSPLASGINHAAEKLKQNGIAVVRIPALPHSYPYEEWNNRNGNISMEMKEAYFPFGLFYTNVIQDSFNGRREIIIPEYGIKSLDDAARHVYESLGAFSAVHSVRSVIEGTQGGGPRCRVQVLGFPDETNPR